MVLVSGCISGNNNNGNTSPEPKSALLSMQPFYGTGFEEIRSFSDKTSNKVYWPVAVKVFNDGEETAYDIRIAFKCEDRANLGLFFTDDGNHHRGWYALEFGEELIPYLRPGTMAIVRPVGFTSEAGYEFMKNDNIHSWNWDGVGLPLSLDCEVTASSGELSAKTNVRTSIA